MLIVDSSLHGHLVYMYPFFNAELGLARQLASHVQKSATKTYNDYIECSLQNVCHPSFADNRAVVFRQIINENTKKEMN